MRRELFNLYMADRMTNGSEGKVIESRPVRHEPV
jgi:hypothetical protein